MKEIDIQNAVRVALSEHGVVLRMNVGQFYTKDGRTIRSGLPAGTSDLLFIGQGKTAFLEVKRPGGRTSPQQDIFLRKMRELGHPAGVVHSVEEAIQMIKEEPKHGISNEL